MLSTRARIRAARLLDKAAGLLLSLSDRLSPMGEERWQAAQDAARDDLDRDDLEDALEDDAAVQVQPTDAARAMVAEWEPKLAPPEWRRSPWR